MFASSFYFTQFSLYFLLFHYADHQVHRKEHSPDETVQVDTDHESKLNRLTHLPVSMLIRFLASFFKDFCPLLASITTPIHFHWILGLNDC